MKLNSLTLRAAFFALAVAVASMLPGGVEAQTVTAQPNFVAPRSVVDLGNGPMEILPLSGNGAVFTQFGTAVGTAPTSTALTLTTSQAANPPCVGCFVTCPSPVNCTIPASTTVAAFNGTTLITLSAAATITAASVNFGQLCPISTQAAPVQPTTPMGFVQTGVTPAAGLPMYTQGRVCAYGGTGPGMQFVNFPIGAH
jgi:hypothetical protein